MKKLSFITSLLLTVVLISCQKTDEYEDVIYVTGTLTQPEIKFNIDGPSSIGMTVTATDKVEQDVNVKLQVRPELIDAYNKKNNRAYEVPPGDAYTMEGSDVTIRGGQYVSTQAKLSVTDPSKLKEGVVYCLPVYIESSDGEMGVLESSRTAYIVVNQIITTKVVDLAGNYYFSVPSFLAANAETSKDVSALNQLTMECKVFVNNFQYNSPFISSVMGIEERFLLRFGDVSCDKDQLQLASGTVGNKRYPMTLDMHFAPGRWYHIAVVYDGMNITLYVDGKAQSSVTTSGGTIDLTWDYMDGFHIGRSERGRYLDGYVSEARVWNVARTSSQLEDGVCYVDPTSEGLVAYWRFNGDSQEGKVPDLTGHGHDAIASGTISWVENQKCPF